MVSPSLAETAMEWNEKQLCSWSQPSKTTTTTTEEPPVTHKLFQVFSTPVAAKILSYLVTQQDVVEKHELVDVLANEPRVGNSEDALFAREKITIALNHVHLPKLRDAGVVWVSPDMELIKLIIPTAQLDPYIDLLKLEENDD